MNSTSSITNKSFRKIISPELINSGFELINPRNGWRWNNKTIWVFSIRSIGSYISSITGWPSSSVIVRLGVFYTFMPIIEGIKTDKSGRLTPIEHTCQMRYILECNIDHKSKVGSLQNPAERLRTDIWWIEADGINADEIAISIRRAFLEQGMPWLTRLDNLEEALELIEDSDDCYNKFATAYFISKELGDKKKTVEYFVKTEKECNRIGNSTNPTKWYVFGG